MLTKPIAGSRISTPMNSSSERKNSANDCADSVATNSDSRNVPRNEKKVLMVLNVARRRAAALHHHHHRIFDQLLERRDELGAERAVDGAMVARQRAGHD